MTNKILFLAMMLLTCISASKAQNNVGINTNTPHASAALEVSASDKGILIPNVSLTNITSAAPVASPATGLMVYNTNAAITNGNGVGYYYWDGAKWVKMVAANSTPWSIKGNAGIDTSINFLGTTDFNPVVFKYGNQRSGHLSQFSTSFGYRSLLVNQESFNSAFGSNALKDNTTGSYNTAAGYTALWKNTTGGGNTAIGASSLFDNVESAANTAVGWWALRFTVGQATNGRNVGVGVSAGENNTTGIENTFVGTSAGYTNTTGSKNTFLGYYADADSVGLTNATAIGYSANVASSNSLVLGGYGLNKVRVGIGLTIPTADLDIKQSQTNEGIKLIYHNNSNSWRTYVDAAMDYNFAYNGALKGYINDLNGVYTSVSDLRMKKDISDVKNVLPKLLKLQAKTYHYKDNAADAPLSYGFIAQEVETLFPEFVTTKEDSGMKAIGYDNFAVIAVEAIKEQQAMIVELKREVEELKKLLTSKK